MRSLGRRLADDAVGHGPVLLLYPAGIEFVVAFLACLDAGAIAVPAYPPDEHRLQRTLPRLRSIARDCGAQVILTTTGIRQVGRRLLAQAPELAGLTWIATDAITTDGGAAEGPLPDPERLAFLQYTSGSTGDPKGVMIRHRHLTANLRQMHAAWTSDGDHRFVSWLPLYHDMGLIATVLHGLWIGAPCTLMSPLHFMRQPVLWLEALSKYRGTISLAPNFAYDLCVRKVAPKELEPLRLDGWRAAINAAEPVHAATMERFAAHVASTGFRAEALQPSYGLAEAVVFSTSRGTARPPHVLARSRRALEAGRSEAPESPADTARFASVGRPWLGQEMAVVDPDTGAATAPGTIGEVWLRGPNVPSGYWGRPEASAAAFGASRPGDPRPYLRTGDLGFVADGELYIAGRRKDLLIVRGANHYPQDLERTAQEAWSGVRPGCVVAFAVERDGEEAPVLVLETARGEDECAAGAPSVIRAIAAGHDLALEALVFIAPGTLPKTSSGKVQRRVARRAFLEGHLDVRWRWGREMATPEVATEAEATTSSSDAADRLLGFIVGWLQARTGAPSVPATRPFAELGVDSATSVELAVALSRRVGFEVPATWLWKHATPAELAAAVARPADPSKDPGERELERLLREGGR